MDTGNSLTPTHHTNQDVEIAPSDEKQHKLDDFLIAEWNAMTFEESALPTLMQKVLSSDTEDVFYGLVGLRKLLSGEEPLIQPIIDLGAVPRLIQLTSLESSERIQLEVAWCLTNLCSGTTEQTLYVIQQGALASFLSLLKSENLDVAEQSIWGLGNIAGDNAQFRDLILNQNGIEELVKVLAKSSNPNLKKNGAWALTNLCRGKPAPAFALIFKAIPQLCEYLNKETDSAILIDVAWALVSVTGDIEGINSVLSHNVVPKLIKLFSHTNTTLAIPCLRIIGNAVAGTNEQASVVLKEKNLIPELFKLADSEQKVLRREAIWILSNITAGTPAQFEAIMGNPLYVEKLISATEDDEPDVKKEAIWALSNSTATCTPAQIIRILNNGVFGCLVDLLDEEDEEFLLTALEGVENCLKWGDEFNMKNESGMNKFVAEIENKGGVDKLENLQTHQNNEVYEQALKILTKYFDLEQEQDG